VGWEVVKRCKWCGQDRDMPKLTVHSAVFGSVCCYPRIYELYASKEYDPAKRQQELDDRYQAEWLQEREDVDQSF